MLNFKKFGEGSETLIILHGLFGSLDNWQGIAQIFSKDFTVYAVDQRNHGKSPHFNQHNYSLMAADLNEFMVQQKIDKAHLLGHSMGGKTVMQAAVDYPAVVDKLIVADMAPKYYAPHHQTIIKALKSVDFNKVSGRKDIQEILESQIDDHSVVQFLLKGVMRITKSEMGWKFNLATISDEIENIGEALSGHVYYTNPALFLKGENSNYILEEDEELIETSFPVSEIVTIENAGHWLHAENTPDFVAEVLRFLK